MMNAILNRNLLVISTLLAVAGLLATGCPSPSQTDRGLSEGQPRDKAPATTHAAQRLIADEEASDLTAGEDGVADETDTTAADAPFNGAYAADEGYSKDGDKEYPPFFENWPKPLLTLYFTGRQHGYIEPCGCTGLANQKGGLSRRHVFYEQLAEKGWNPVAIDIGNQVRRFGRQPEIKFQSTVAGMKKIGYEAIGFGPDDLRMSFGELLSAAIVGDDGQPAPFVSANVKILDDQPPSYRVIEAAGKRIGITAILGKEEQRSVASEEIKITDADEALAKVVPALRDEKCDIYILLSHASGDESKRLGAKFPLFDLVVTAGSAGEPSHLLEPIEGSKGKIVQIGTKGMYISAVGVFDDEQTPYRLQRAPLDGRFEDSKEMLKLMAAYQQQLEAVGLEGLAVKPLPHPTGRKFVGSQVCADCHDREYEIWKETPHAHATDSIVNPAERSEIPRHHDPECLSCHVTGWNPQEYYPYESGYLSLDKSKHLHQMGCENCHGPGSDHVAAENGEIGDEEKHRQDMILTLDTARDTCLKCHDLDNSPAFHEQGAFEKYWERVKH